MNPNQPQYPLDEDAPQNVENPLAVMQPGERVVCEIRRHPIGLVSVFGVTALVLGALISVVILTPIYLTFFTPVQRTGIMLFAGVLAILTLILAYIAIFIYQSNRWIVTSDSITEDSRSGLFDTESEQLSLANLEDVSVNQDGFFEQLLDYGTLRVETAGESSKFVFVYCPNPKDYARKIIAAHEEFIALEKHSMEVANLPLNAGAHYNQSGPPPAAPSAE